MSTRDINQFHFKVNQIEFDSTASIDDPNERKLKQLSNNINSKGSVGRVLSEMHTSTSSSSSSTSQIDTITPSFVSKSTKKYNTAHYSDNSAAASFTSMGSTVVTKNAPAIISDEEYLLKHVEGSAFAKLVTSLGDLNLELYCGDCPKTTYNFIQLAKKGAHKLLELSLFFSLLSC